ncbi:MAG TPA: sulfatase-like hydrolase/transferase [Allosphingosinicella sp.]|nr:sulfatase-like hydrolase/transferase [Allosphingosinicella sp.]
MSAELAALPQRIRLRVNWADAARFTLPGVILITLAAELLLAERKYAIFGGGFGQSRALDTPLETGAFLAGLLLCQTMLFLLLYRLMRRLHRKRPDGPLFHFNFAFFAGGGALALLIGKYQALAFFSDAMSFQIVRNLGGGSLTDALLYSLSEAGLMLIVGGAALLFYAAVRFAFRKRWRDAAPLPDHWRLSGRQLALLLGATPLVLFAVNRVDDSRAALSRFNSVVAVSTVLEQATDFDRDGYSFFSFPLDRQPFDGSRHPYALDIPGDGIDQDGLGGDFVFSQGAPPTARAVIAGRRPNVILIVLESTRADAIGRRVDGRPLTPVLDALAANGSAARRAYSHVGFTTNSLQSLFSGKLAPVDDRQSLVRDFLANGYQVGVFSGQAEDFGDTANLVGLRRGAIFVDGTMLKDERSGAFAAQGSVNIDGRILLREFDRRLGRPEAWERPHFLYFNLQSAHFPYFNPGMDRILPGEPIARGEIAAANRDRVARTYWNAIAYNDRLIGALIERLRRLGVLDNSMIVVTADHGESLFDDGFLGHGHMLNEQQTRIPFILSAPNVAMPDVIGLDDMRAVILAAAGAGAGAGVAPPSGRPVFQFLGSLDRPGAIGTVDGAGRRLVFDFFQETVWDGATGRRTRYADLIPSSPEKRAADALIEEWARQRWLRHLEGGG